MTYISNAIYKLFKKPKISYHHHNPSVPNIGDLLCSPKHYFYLSSDNNTLIVGGGAFHGLGVDHTRRTKSSHRIAWAIGQSHRFNDTIKPLDEQVISSHYSIATTRDKAFASNAISLLPCVSVLNSITETPIGTEKGILLNYDIRASGNSVDSILRKYENDGYITISNALSYNEYVNEFKKTKEIITNSYHAAYWGLLSGRRIKLIGYSSKFISLLDLFDQDQASLLKYDKGDALGLSLALENLSSAPTISLKNHREYLHGFRQMNIDFSKSLSAIGVEATLKHRAEL